MAVTISIAIAAAGSFSSLHRLSGDQHNFHADQLRNDLADEAQE
jgi:hypothetical protein